MPIPSLREGLGTLLASSAPLTALVNDRIFSQEMPDTYDLPALLFTKISGQLDWAVDGTQTGVVDGRVQFDILADAERQEDIEAITEILLDLASGYQELSAPSGPFQLLDYTPLDTGVYVPDPKGLRYTFDAKVQFGRK